VSGGRVFALGARISLLAVLSFAVLPFAVIASPASAQLPADALVAVVGAETPSDGIDVVYLSDVELRARLELASAGQPALGALAGSLLSATLEEIIGETLVAREARRLRQPDPEADAVEAQRARLVASVGGAERMRDLLAAIGATDGELAAIARRRAAVEAFFRANLEGDTAVSDAELAAVYATNEHPFVGRPLDEVEDALRAWLAMGALRRDVARWLDVLRDRTVVRVTILETPAHPATPDVAEAEEEEL
jgi:hypothetical protein